MLHKHEHLEFGLVVSLLPILGTLFFGFELYEAGWFWHVLTITMFVSIVIFVFASRSFAQIEKRGK